MKSAYLIFIDTETTGLPKNWGILAKNYTNWPSIIQIAWEIYKYKAGNYTLISEYNSYISLKGSHHNRISSGSFKIHGITEEKCNNEGLPLKKALKTLKQTLYRHMPTFVSHCVHFDKSVISAALHSKKMDDFITGIPSLCTMNAGFPIVSNGANKFPSLQQLYKALFGLGFDGTHDAYYDCVATRKVFFEMLNKGYIIFNKKNLGFFDYPESTKRMLKAHNKW